MQYSSLSQNTLIEMCKYRTFQYAVWKTEIPNTEFIHEFWRTKRDELSLVLDHEKGISETAYLAIKDEFVIARYFAKLARVRLHKMENGGGRSYRQEE